MKKRWYDYLWIVELTYMALGFFNILFAWLGMLFFCIPLIISVCLGYKGVLQPLLRPGAAVQPAGRALWTVPEKGYSQVDEKQMVPLWLPDFLFCHVLPNAMDYLSGLCRRPGSAAGGEAAVGL